jgi:hypothetical protein
MAGEFVVIKIVPVYSESGVGVVIRGIVVVK